MPTNSTLMRPWLALIAVALVAPASAATATAEHGESTESCRAMLPLSVPVATGTCTGVRPGAWVFSSVGRCSFNFVFDGSDGHTYIGTAGHCLYKDDYDERSWSAGTGPGAWDGQNRRIGEFAYAALDWRDFALIRVSPGVDVNPAMCHWGGPTGMYTEHELAPMVVRHYGGGVGLGDTIPARTGAAFDSTDEYELSFLGAVLWGDSGSGLMHEDGRAIGVNVRLGGNLGNNTATRLDRQVADAEALLGVQLTLRTAPLEER